MSGKRPVGKRALRRSASSRKPLVNGKKFWAACAALSLCLSTFPTVANAEEVDPLSAGIEESIQAQSAGLEAPAEEQSEAPADEAAASDEDTSAQVQTTEPAPDPEPTTPEETSAPAKTNEPAQTEEPSASDKPEAKPSAPAKLQAKKPGASASPSPSETTSAEPRALAAAVSTPVPNPDPAPQCGMNVVLMIDRSSSIDQTEMNTFKTAAKSFVAELLGTAGRVSVGSFGSRSETRLSATDLTSGNQSAIDAAIDLIPVTPMNSSNRQYTNWEAGLLESNTLASGMTAGLPTIVVFLTDGDPTAYYSGQGTNGLWTGELDSDTFTLASDEAIGAANALKNKGIQVFGMKIGDSSYSYLQKITGSTVWTPPSNTILNSDYVGVTNFASLKGDLKKAIDGLCGQTVQVIKKLITAGGTVENAALQGGVDFAVSPTTPGAQVDLGTITTGLSGSGLGRAEVKVDFPTGANSAVIKLEEDVPPGNEVHSITCTTANSSTNIASVLNDDVKAGKWEVASGADLVICEVINKDIRPTLTLVKKVDNSQYGSAKAVDFTLQVGTTNWATTAVSNTEAKTKTEVVSPGKFNLVDVAKTDYQAGKWTCVNTAKNNAAVPVTDKGAGQGEITLANGEYVLCEITNTGKSPKGNLELVKEVVDPAGLGTLKATNVALSFNGAQKSTTGNDAKATTGSFAVDAGAYTIAEGDYPDYDKSAFVCEATGKDKQTVNSGQKVTVGAGESWKCTITNTLKTGELQLVKVVENKQLTGDLATDFNLQVRDTTWPTTLGPDNSTAQTEKKTVLPGSYKISEGDYPAYAQSQFICVANGQDDQKVTAGNTVAVKAGESWKCTITNTLKTGELQLVKKVENKGLGDKKANEFTLKVGDSKWDTTAIPQSNTAETTKKIVRAGDYKLSEDIDSAYTNSSFECVAIGKGLQQIANGDSLTIGANESWKCTITNTLKTAELTLVKKVTNDDGGSKVAADFLLSADGPTGITNVAPVSVGEDKLNGQVVRTVKPGTYTLSEKNLAGYEAGAWSCVGGSLDGTKLTVKHGESATCTITNDDIAPEIRLSKQVVNDHGGTSLPLDFKLTAAPVTGTSGPGVSANATLGSDGNPSPAGSIKGYTAWTKTSAGQYDLSESVVPGYLVSENWACFVVGKDSRNPIEVSTDGIFSAGLAQKIECGIINDDVKSELSIVKKGVGSAEWLSRTESGDDNYQATFKIEVTATGVHKRVYTLSDDLQIDAAAVIGDITVTNDSGVSQEAIADGSRSFVIATDVSITNKTHTYTVVVDFTIPKAAKSDFDLICGIDEVSGGFPNKATAKSALDSKPLSSSDCVPIGDSPVIDLDIKKSVDAETANIGDVLTYTIKVENTSTVAAREFTVTDSLPDYLEFIAVTDAPVGLTVRPLTASNELIVDGAAGLAANTSISFSFTAKVVAEDDELLAVVGNTACVENQFDPDEEDCSVTETPVNPELRLVKNVLNAFGGSAVPGDFELTAKPVAGLVAPTVAAAAALDSEGEPLEDDADRGYTAWNDIVAGGFVLSESSVEGYEPTSAWSCSVSNGSERSVTVSSEGVFTAGAGERIQCEITNSDVQSPLSIQKEGIGDATWLERTDSDDLYSAEFKISVKADGVHPRIYTLTDTLEISDAAIIGDINVTSENDVPVEDIVSGSRSFTIAEDVSITNTTHVYKVVVEFKIPLDERSGFDYECYYGDPGGFPNLAEFFSDLADEVTSDDDCVDIPTPPSIDLSLEKSAILEEGEENANVGGNIKYELVVTNNSDRDAFEFTVTDELPLYVNLVGEPEVPADVVFDGNIDGVLKFKAPAGLKPGATVTITFNTKYEPPLDLPHFYDIWNTACVASAFDDSDSQVADRRARTSDEDYYFGNDCDTTVTPVNPRLTLVKTVDNSEYGTNVAADFLLSAQGPRGWESEAPVPVDEADPLVAAISKNVLQGEFLVWEDNLEDYVPSAWTCEPREDNAPRTISGPVARATNGEELPENSIGFGLDNGDNYLCTITNTGQAPVIDLDITKEAILEDGATAIDLGETFKYLLTVTNNSDRTAHKFTVTDHLPEHLTVVGVEGLPTGWTEDSTVAGKHIFQAPAGLEAGESASVTLLVKYDPPRRVDGVFINEFEPVVNTACVESEFDPDSPEEDCADAEVPIKQINPNAYVECKYDVPYVTFDVSTTNYNLVPGSTMYMNWYEVDGTEILHTDTYTVDENGVLSGSQLWPGSAVDEDGISILWPGWRPAGPGETPTWEHLVLDPDYHTYVFRNPLRVEFVINPTAIIDALYPPADPDCAVDRDADIKLDKTASEEQIVPGQEFTYELAATNEGMGSLKDVKIGDEIPADIEITDISFDKEAFPTWENCAITGDKNGYGGILECELNGYAPPENALPVLTLTAKLSPDSTADEIVNSAAVCGFAVDTEDDVLLCGEDEVTTTVIRTINPPEEPGIEENPPTELPQTGANPMLPLWALTLVLVGVGFQLTNRRRSDKAA